jgi:DNA polymerase I
MARAPLTAHAAELYATGAPVVLAGDYNVVPTDLDIYPTKSWDRDAPLQPQSRAANQHLLSQGWTDAIRARHPKEPMYTFWDYKRNRWERDGGLRLDHIQLSSALMERLQDAGVDRQARAMEGASDHAPVWVKLRDAPDRRGTPLRQTSGQTTVATATVLPKVKRSTHRTGDGARRRSRAARFGPPALSGRPLLVMDGNSFAHRSIEQLGVLPEFVAACGFANAKAPGFEAGDFLAAAVAAEERAGGAALVASGDRDAFQLASPRTTILYPSRGGEIGIGPEEVRHRYGVDPKQVPDFIALRGDPSDKLPGAAGVGPKRAAQMVRRYGSLDGVLDAGLFLTEAKMLGLYRRIATMDASAPLPSLADHEPTWASASTLARSWSLKQLADRLAEKA